MLEKTSAILAEIAMRKKKLQYAMKEKCPKMKEDSIGYLHKRNE